MAEARKCDTCKVNKVCDHNRFGFENCDNYISSDVVEVVRCKNCKNYNTEGCSEGWGWCESSNSGTNDYRYCSDGERKE